MYSIAIVVLAAGYAIGIEKLKCLGTIIPYKCNKTVLF